MEKGDYCRRLKAQWLPYYGEELRRERLAMVRRYCLNNLHTSRCTSRAAFISGLRSAYHAFGEFLQALFLARRVYPICYSKWIRSRLRISWSCRQLYRKLPRLFEIERFESGAIAEKGAGIEELLNEYVR